jgi:hypothetical protein
VTRRFLRSAGSLHRPRQSPEEVARYGSGTSRFLAGISDPRTRLTARKVPTEFRSDGEGGVEQVPSSGDTVAVAMLRCADAKE